MLTYNLDEFTTTTTTTVVDPWTRTSPPNGRRSDGGSEEAIIQSVADGVSDGNCGSGSYERSQSSRGILKTMEVQVNSQNMERNVHHGTATKNKALLPWEPTSPI